MNNTEWPIDGVNKSITPRVMDDRDLLGNVCQAYTTCVAYARSGIVIIGDFVPGYFVMLRAVLFGLGTNVMNYGITANTYMNDNPFIANVVASK